MFAIKLKQFRELKGWTKSRLADETKISQTYVSELEANKKQPTAPIIIRIAKALRC